MCCISQENTIETRENYTQRAALWKLNTLHINKGKIYVL